MTALAMICAAGCGGCGSTATITLVDGHSFEARIVRSDARALYLPGPSGEEADLVSVERSTVSEVSHPGKVAIVIGAVLLGGLGLLAMSGSFRRELIHGPAGDTSNGARPLTLLFGAPGTGLLGYGLFRYISSKRAADGWESPPDPP